MIPSCFSNPNTRVVAGSSNSSENLTTCTYQAAELFSSWSSARYVTLTWSKSRNSHSLTIYVPDTLTIAISLLTPALSSIFKSRPRSGSKSIFLPTTNNGVGRDLHKVKVLWEFSRAKFCQSSAAPESGFYVAILCDGELQFFVGDNVKEKLTTKQRATVEAAAVVSRREHVFGHRSYKSSRVELLGLKRDILIECYSGMLKVKVDGQTCLVVKRLAWKFRGNERIVIGGVEVEFYWDVFNWVNTGRPEGHGLFMFLVGEGSGAWPEMVGPEKKLMKKKSCSVTPLPASLSPTQSCSSVLQWAEESSDGSCRRWRSSSSDHIMSSARNAGFSLLMYAWRKD
uniref:Uncharacterized protein n=1 Tax=Kalanchoe fedtschenkoi TaxID=63787 RepID=A0A7N0V1Z8_KALFE